MPSLETHSPDTAPSFDAHADDVLSLQTATEAARRLETQAAYEPAILPVAEAQPQETNAGNPNSVRNKVLVATATIATAATAAAGGFAVGGASERQHQDTAQVVASSSFTPSAEYGDLIGPANEEVNQLLENNGIDPNTISYSDVQAELTDASEELQAATGRTEPTAGQPYDVDLITSTGLLGEKRISIDITPVVANEPQASETPPATAPPTESNE